MFVNEAQVDTRRPFKKRVATTKKTPSERPEEPDTQAPGVGKIFLKTYGCSHNISDSEYMAGLLQDYGFTLSETMEQADCCLINSCTVKNPSETKFVNLVEKAQKAGKPVVVSGCVPQGDRNLKGLETVSILGVT